MQDTWIQTFTGKKFDFAAPHPSMIDIKDIAHALSNQCRFNGHCREFYSVAEHSVYVCQLVMQTHPDLGMAALMHDAAEAYIGDMVTPLKAMMPSFKAMEAKVEKVIADRFGFDHVQHHVIKKADMQLLVDEKNKLHVNSDNLEWVIEQTFRPNPTRHLGLYAPHAAEALFLGYFRRLQSRTVTDTREY
jgi:hypothetical protein